MNDTTKTKPLAQAMSSALDTLALCDLWTRQDASLSKDKCYEHRLRVIREGIEALKSVMPNPKMSDGYHTFEELYDHRCTLFLALMKAVPEIAWISKLHDDGSSFDGWFIAGMNLATGTVTYHLPAGMWSLACETGAKPLERAPKWDGHTSADVVKRVQTWIAS